MKPWILLVACLGWMGTWGWNCQDKECLQGDRSCEARDVLHCRSGYWQRVTCASGLVCQKGFCQKVSLVPANELTPEMISEPAQEPIATFPDGGSEQNVADSCTEGEQRCLDAATLERCEGGRWKQSFCAQGMSCKVGQCSGSTACQESEKRCESASVAMVCVQSQWQKTPCSAAQQCQNGVCVAAPQCTDGERRCKGTTAEERCVQGQWQTQNCSSGQTCQKNQCETSTTDCATACKSGQICSKGQCIPWSVNYRKVQFAGNPTDRNPPQHADLNLKLRGWQKISGESTQLVNYNGATDPDAPKIYAMFPSGAFPGIVNNYQVGEWDWGKNAKSGWITSTFWKVHLVGFRTNPGDKISIPSRGPDIAMGWARALVLYVDQDSITFVYTSEDTVANGYAVHVNGVHIAVDLANLYQQTASRSTRELPALENGQPFGVAIGNEVRVAIRDRGAFMDPRTKKDWW